MSFLLLQLSNSFLRNDAVFFNSSVLMVTPSFSRYASNLLLTTPSAPTTASTTSRCLIPHIVFQFVSSGPDISQSFHLPFHTLCDPGRSYIRYDCLVIFILSNNNFRSPGLDSLVTLDGQIPQDLTFFVFHCPFWLMFMSLLILLLFLWPQCQKVSQFCHWSLRTQGREINLCLNVP